MFVCFKVYLTSKIDQKLTQNMFRTLMSDAVGVPVAFVWCVMSVWEPIITPSCRESTCCGFSLQPRFWIYDIICTTSAFCGFSLRASLLIYDIFISLPLLSIINEVLCLQSCVSIRFRLVYLCRWAIMLRKYHVSNVNSIWQQLEKDISTHARLLGN